MLIPQHHTSPLLSRAHEWRCARSSSTILSSATLPALTTRTAIGALSTALLPSSPDVPWPQHHTVPPVRTTHAWLYPAESAIASTIGPVASTTCTGRGTGIMLVAPLAS